jgi:diguanylate cyclase (GGDEF)-like protein/PAS domain S-box-containing protein
LRALVQAVPQGLALSRDRRFEWANPRFCADLGWAGSELPGRSPYEVFSSVNADDRLGAALRTAFAAGQPYAGDLLFRRRDGSRFPGRLQARPIDPADPAAGTLWQLDDLSAPPVEQRQLGWAAHHDPLTGLLNRPGFEARLAAWLQQAPPGQTASLLHVDLDGFKACNAAAGRDAGDALLRAAADTLLAHVRAGDAVARFEADTYALLLPGCVAAVAVQLGRRLRDELAGLGVTHQGQRLRVGATVGVAEIERPAASVAPAGRPGTPGVESDLNAGQTAAPRAADWLARSHAAWYEAKYGGSGAVRLAAPTASVALVLPT